MDAALLYVLIIGFVCVAGFIAAMGAYIEWLRSKRLGELAAELGLEFKRPRNRALYRELHFIDDLREGDDQYAYNVLSGVYRGWYIMAFDFHWVVWTTGPNGEAQKESINASVFVVRPEMHMPELRIYPECFFSKLGRMIGFKDIELESIEFSKKYVVKSQDKRFAYDVCHPRFMEYLMPFHNLTLEYHRDCIATKHESRTPPDKFRLNIDRMVDIADLLPEYVRRDHAHSDARP